VDIAPINEQLQVREPDQMEVRSISQYGRILELVFSFHGGPKEMQQFLVTFEEAAILRA
jgi:hypothetical protein